MPKRYEVVGTQPVLEHQPGEKFTADVPADLEEFLVGVGGLKVLGDAKPKLEYGSPRRR